MLRVQASILLCLSLAVISYSIKFSIVLPQRQIQCFHESAQKGIRYQIDIKGNSSRYGLQINEQIQKHSDIRIQEHYKYFSAFADTDFGVSFCMNSLADEPIELQVQFYHGFYLQDFQSLKNANEFWSMTKRMQQISGMIQMNYEKYKGQILEREPINNRIEIYSTFAILIFLLVVFTIKIWYLNKIVKFMKTRKLI